MTWRERGKVQGGNIVFAEPLTLPEGTEVEVRIEKVEGLRPSTLKLEEVDPVDDLAELPFFGMWKDREDMRDSVAWVNQQRASWNRYPRAEE